MATDSQSRAVPEVGLPPEVIEDILSAPRRRRMLEVLAESEGCMVVDDIAAAVEADDSDPRERLRAEIYDEHLPKLTATGVVDYDSMRGCVSLRSPAIVDHIDG